MMWFIRNLIMRVWKTSIEVVYNDGSIREGIIVGESKNHYRIQAQEGDMMYFPVREHEVLKTDPALGKIAWW